MGASVSVEYECLAEYMLVFVAVIDQVYGENSLDQYVVVSDLVVSLYPDTSIFDRNN